MVKEDCSLRRYSGKIIDSHVHLDLIYQNDPERIIWLQEHNCTVVSWAFSRDLKNISDLKLYLRRQARLIKDLRQGALDCYYLTGIHPRNITADLKSEYVAEILLPFLDDPFCLGIGEIGLETGSEKEKQIFAAQLDLGKQCLKAGKKIGIHTPRTDKMKITHRIITMLENYRELQDDLVIDHCTADTLGWILENGYRAGITLSPIKTAWETLPVMVQKYEHLIDHIMCNTDSGSVFYEDLVHAAQSADLDSELKKKLLFENAARFFQLM